jgi:hypothetical protein
MPTLHLRARIHAKPRLEQTDLSRRGKDRVKASPTNRIRLRRTDSRPEQVRPKANLRGKGKARVRAKVRTPVVVSDVPEPMPIARVSRPRPRAMEHNPAAAVVAVAAAARMGKQLEMEL